MGKKLTTKRVIRAGRMAWADDSCGGVMATILYDPRSVTFVTCGNDVQAWVVDGAKLRSLHWHHDPSCDCKYCRGEV